MGQDEDVASNFQYMLAFAWPMQEHLNPSSTLGKVHALSLNLLGPHPENLG